MSAAALASLLALGTTGTWACATDGGPPSAAVLGVGPVLDAGPAAREAAAPEPCRNGVTDGEETDVDCGGAVCPACANGQACRGSTDCASLVCAGAACTGDIGCADGTREGFASLDAYANIAACAGAWNVPGVLPPATHEPACGRGAGNDGANRAGTGCNVADLCQEGWHVCAGPEDVAASTAGRGCAGIAAGDQFFVTRQSGAGGGACAAGANDLFGCGVMGAAPDATTCGPLDRFSHDLCSSLSKAWSCGADPVGEANQVTKTAVEGGGVLCCRG